MTTRVPTSRLHAVRTQETKTSASKKRVVTQDKVTNAFKLFKFIDTKGEKTFGLVSPVPAGTDKGGKDERDGTAVNIYYDYISRMKGTSKEIAEALSAVSFYNEYKNTNAASVTAKIIIDRAWTPEKLAIVGSEDHKVWSEMVDKYKDLVRNEQEGKKEKDSKSKLDDVTFLGVLFEAMEDFAKEKGLDMLFGRTPASNSLKNKLTKLVSLNKSEDRQVMNVSHITPTGQDTSKSLLNVFLKIKKAKEAVAPNETVENAKKRKAKLRGEFLKSRYFIPMDGNNPIAPHTDMPIWSHIPSTLRNALEQLISDGFPRAQEFLGRFNELMRNRKDPKILAGEPSISLIEAMSSLSGRAAPTGAPAGGAGPQDEFEADVEEDEVQSPRSSRRTPSPAARSRTPSPTPATRLSTATRPRGGRKQQQPQPQPQPTVGPGSPID